MRAKDIAGIIEKLAPLELAYKEDENGFVWGNSDKEVSILGVVERPTIKTIKEALEKQVEMLVIHEPLLQSKKAFLVDSSVLKYPPNEIRESLLNKGQFVVYRAHSNLDDADEGLNVILAKTLELNIMQKLPYGRLGTIEPRKLSSFVGHVKEKLGCESVLVVGELEKLIEKVAVVAGGGNALIDLIEFAKQQGADVMVSGDIQDSRARFATELDLAIIDVGSYYTQRPGMKHFADLLQSELPDLEIIFLDPSPPWEVE